MKKIVVGIDFLDSSINALKHALSIANRAECDILMVWVNRPEYSKEVVLFEPEKLPGIVHDKFEAIINEYKDELPNGKLEYKVREGKVYKELCDEAESIKADMIVVGTHGSSGFEEFWIGSNANKIVSATDIPVITIRAGINIQRPLARIVLPIDSSLETRQKVTFTGILAKIHDAEVYILSLYSTKVGAIRNRVDVYTDQVIEFFDEEEVKYRVDVREADNITYTTIDYAKSIDANLIAITTEQEKSNANLWLGPYAQQMVNHSPIPVLTIHSHELIKSLSGG